ncbi:MAG: saccharopine dehydrogenase [Caulobacteraceae bacterium]|nr:MAG: saccharopine dehydrogenase [Caulobacteraceae bacterium]
MTQTEPRQADPLIAILGAAGQMTSVTALALIARRPEFRYVLMDIDLGALGRTFKGKTGPNVKLQRVDLADSDGLRRAIHGARLLINGAGPFHKTAGTVRSHCLDLGIDYFDIDDDVESTQAGIALDREAASRGVALYVGHGASPGFTNLLAVDLLKQLDEPETVEVAWVVGDEGKSHLGRAVAQHTMHVGAGHCLTWRDGREVVHESFADSTVFPVGGSLGDYRLYECAHPEPVTIPWSYPSLRSVTCWGGLHPQSVNGLLRGVATAVASGDLSMDQGCAFLQAVMADQFGSFAGWGRALSGMRAQVRAGHTTKGELRAFLWDAIRNVHRPTRSGMAARVSGRRNGRSVTLVRQAAALAPGTFLDTMASITGLSAAAFALMLLDGPKRIGFQPPERWADGPAFYELCRNLGSQPLDAVVGPIIET